MIRRMVSALIVAALAATPATAAGGTRHASPPPVTVKPGSGGTKTRFVVSFRAPERTGLVGKTLRRYQVNATGPARSGCVSDPFAEAPPSRKGTRVKLVLDPAKLMVLDPAKLGGVWCVGTYRGEVEEIETPLCPLAMLCPAFFVVVRTVGTFKFHVKASSSDPTPA